MQEELKNKKLKTEKQETNKNIAALKESKKVSAPRKFFYRRKTYKHNQPNEEKLAQDFTDMLSKSLKTMIPWILVPTLLFFVGAYYIYQVVAFNYYTPLWFKIVFGIINFGFFLVLGIIYGLLMGVIASLKIFSQNFGLLIKQSMNSLRTSLENKINSLSFEMFSKKEISALIAQTFDDFNNKIRKYAKKTALGFLAIGIISSVLFFARHFIVRSFGAIKNKAEAFALISARTSLFVAILLNLTLFVRIILWIGTFIGIGILLLQALFVLYFR